MPFNAMETQEKQQIELEKLEFADKK